MTRRGISQAELAKRLSSDQDDDDQDVTQQFLSRRISGRVPFKVDELHRIAEALGVPAAELLSVGAEEAAS